MVEIPADGDAQLQVPDLLMEVAILERFNGEPCICPLLDFGVTPTGFRLVMPRFRCTLAEWRAQLPSDVGSVVPLQRLFLNIFRLVRARCLTHLGETSSFQDAAMLVHLLRARFEPCVLVPGALQPLKAIVGMCMCFAVGAAAPQMRRYTL